MFWWHLKCSRTSTKTWGTWTSSGIFLCFFLLSQLREPERLGTSLSGPVSRLASAKTSSSYDNSLMVDCQYMYSLLVYRTQGLGEKTNLEGLANNRLDELTIVPQHWPFYPYAERERTQKEWDKTLRWRHSDIHCTHYDARRRVKDWVFPETLGERAGRLSGSFRLRGHRTVQTRSIPSRSVHHRIFPGDVYFHTQSVGWPHERPPNGNGVKEWASFCLVFRSLNTSSSCRKFFHGLQEGPNPLKETLTFNEEFFNKTPRSLLRPADSKGPQFLWTQPEFLDCPRFDRYGFRRKKKIYRTPEAKGKKRRSIASWLQRHRTRNVSSSSWQFRVVLAEQAAFHTPDLRDRQGWSMLSDCSNFEDEETAALCTGPWMVTPESVVHKNIFLKVGLSLSKLRPSEPHRKLFVKRPCGSSNEKKGGKLLLSWRHWAPVVRPAQRTG